jgi:DNA-directed RNA polymerase subunit RPC12/RpoP
MNIGQPRRYLCPKCGGRVIVSRTITDFGEMTEYKCVDCSYYHNDEFKYGDQGSWSKTADDDLPIIAPNPLNEQDF